MGYTRGVNFEWDPEKAAYNLETHGVSFAEATTVFGDPLSMLFDDPDHSLDESRALIIGRSYLDRLLIVSFTERVDSIRVISARELTPNERRDYENG